MARKGSEEEMGKSEDADGEHREAAAGRHVAAKYPECDPTPKVQ
jgi:hypothetical protein